VKARFKPSDDLIKRQYALPILNLDLNLFSRIPKEARRLRVGLRLRKETPVPSLLAAETGIAISDPGFSQDRGVWTFIADETQRLQPQRGCVLQPRVARLGAPKLPSVGGNELPWVKVKERINPKGVVAIRSHRLSRVGAQASRQHRCWAGGRNPFGVEANSPHRRKMSKPQGPSLGRDRGAHAPRVQFDAPSRRTSPTATEPTRRRNLPQSSGNIPAPSQPAAAQFPALL